VTSAAGFAGIGDPDLLPRLARPFGRVRGWGDCYGHLLVATGRVEAMVDPVLEIWDAAPLQVVIEESGGRFTDREGRRTHTGRAGISTNAALHRVVMDELSAPCA
jgi:fructose-1,6-bisphosphatase/inositol monophosphatase family enzyme